MILTKTELRILTKFTSPFQIQEFLDSIPYSDEERYRCPRSVLQDRKAHCYDVRFLPQQLCGWSDIRRCLSTCFRTAGTTTTFSAIFRRNNRWGAVAKSNFSGLRFREPVYRGLRELIMSYFELYYNIAGEKTLLGYTAPLNLNRFDKLNWLLNDEAMDAIAKALDGIRKYKIITPAMSRATFCRR